MYYKTKPFKHQAECLMAIGDRPYYGLFLEPGLGKSKVAIDLIANRKLTNKTYPTLVVCPNTLVENWADEVSKHSDLTCVMLTGAKQRRIAKLEAFSDIYILNYESVRILENYLILRKFSCLILDESTALKNPNSLQSKACFRLSQHIPNVYILTGTPVMNNPLDLFGQFRCLDVHILGPSYWRFRYHYAVWGGYMNKQVVKWVNINKLKDKIFAHAIHQTKDQCLDLPDKLYQVVHVDLPSEQREVYANLKLSFISKFRDTHVTAPVILTKLLRFSQITAGFTKDVNNVEMAFKTNPKADWVLDFLSSLDPMRKVVCFCRFIKEIHMLEKALDDAGIKFVRVSGEVKERIDKVKEFNEDPDVRVFIGQLQTSGIGINLTSAHYVVFMSNSYSYGERIQAEDRCHRIGQQNNVTYIDLLARNTIDEAIHKTLKRKESLANMVIGDIINML